MKDWFEKADEETVGLAQDVVAECRASLMMAFRFMDSALWRLPLVERSDSFPFATDGRVLRFDARHIIRDYRTSTNSVARGLLHSVLHCVFRHPFDAGHADGTAWGLACDVTVEAIAMEMCAKRFPCENDGERKELLEVLKQKTGATLTPFKLYRLFSSIEAGRSENAETGMTMALMHQVNALFVRDGHDAWAVWRTDEANRAPRDEGPEDVPDAQRMEKQLQECMTGMNEESEEAPDEKHGGSSDEQSDEKGSGAGVPDESEEREALEDSEDGADDGAGDDAGGGAEDDDAEDGADDDAEEADFEEARRAWEEIGKQVEADLESHARDWGMEPGDLMTNLAVANRRRCDYADFLRRFSTMSEEMMVNDDEFDYIFYTYGLKCYGNMPLVEPLEYKEDNRVKEFVIALDTSGSCSGKLIKSFVTRTYEILREAQSFGTNMNVHIVQCDRKVQSDTKIRNLEELEQFGDSFWVKGYGGTDFRPVFDYVDELIDQGEFAHLRGLIYFTDGMGTFPVSPPDYDVAFVFVDDEGARRRVPPWAMKVVIDEDDIREL